MKGKQTRNKDQGLKPIKKTIKKKRKKKKKKKESNRGITCEISKENEGEI